MKRYREWFQSRKNSECPSLWLPVISEGSHRAQANLRDGGTVREVQLIRPWRAVRRRSEEGGELLQRNVVDAGLVHLKPQDLRAMRFQKELLCD